MTDMLTVIFYLLIWVTLTYLIYRYGRYSSWNKNPAGQAFMTMKCAFWLLVTYALAVAGGLDGAWQDFFRSVALISIEIALLIQVHLVVKLQGGWRRKRAARERDHPEWTGHRRRRILGLRAEKRRLAALAETENS